MNTAGLSPEQVAFLERQAAERGMRAPAPAPSAGASAAGLSEEQRAFLERQQKARAGVPYAVLDAEQTAPDVASALAALLIGFFVGSAVTYAVVRIWRSS